MSQRQHVKVITGVERRRRFSAEEKGRLVAETFQPGASIAAVAARHDLSPRLLYLWRSRLKQAGLLPPAQERHDAFVEAATVATGVESVVRVHLQHPMVIDFPVGMDPRQVAAVLRSLRDEVNPVTTGHP